MKVQKIGDSLCVLLNKRKCYKRKLYVGEFIELHDNNFYPPHNVQRVAFVARLCVFNRYQLRVTIPAIWCKKYGIKAGDDVPFNVANERGIMQWL